MHCFGSLCFQTRIMPVCFCQEPVTEFKNKDGGAFYKCGVKLDWKKINDKVKKCKQNQKKRRKVYRKQNLGCRLSVSAANYDKLDKDLFSMPPKEQPKCEHHLFCKVGIAKSAQNMDRNFFACAATFPDPPCEYFKWVNEDDDSSSSDDSDDSDESSSDDEEERKSKKRKRQAEDKKDKKKKNKK